MRRYVGLLIFTIITLSLGCVPPAPTIVPTADIPATMEAVVVRVFPTATPTPATDIKATVESYITATIEAKPTPTNTPKPIPTAIPIHADDLSEMVARVRPAVVRIIAGSAGGTGVIVAVDDSTAYVVSNHHVVEGYPSVRVTVNDSQVYSGIVLATDDVMDVAVVSICCDNFTALDFAEGGDMVVGDYVVNMGYALLLEGEATVSTGIISALRYDSYHRTDVIQTDAPMNPGNSGGPC